MAEFRLERNPLNKVLGSILRKQREENEMTYKDVHLNYSISESYMRALELGTFTLHISKAIPLYHFLNYATQEDDFRLDGLIQYLSLISILETTARDKEKKINGKALEGAAIDICGWDTKYRVLLEPFITGRFFVKEYNKTDDYDALERHVHNFLTKYDTFDLTPGEKQNKFLSEIILKMLGETPSIYAPQIFEIAQQFQSLPVRIFLTDMGKWEKKYEQQFESINCIFSGDYEPSNEEDINNLSYNYLWNEGFTGLNIYLVGKNGKTPDMQKKFEANLRKHYENEKSDASKKILADWEKGVSKVKFIPIKSSSETKWLLEVKDPQTLDYNIEDRYDAFWIFKFFNDTHVAFLGKEKKVLRTNSYVVEQGRSILLKDLYPYIEKSTKIFTRKSI